jgi:hypothetical protein
VKVNAAATGAYPYRLSPSEKSALQKNDSRLWELLHQSDWKPVAGALAP